MRIHCESILWEDDGHGRVRATLTDNDLNILQVEHDAGSNVTFRTEGNPSFDVHIALEIGLLCLALTRHMLTEADMKPQLYGATRSGDGAVGGAHVPRQPKVRKSDARREVPAG
jgi:hypothetical protein